MTKIVTTPEGIGHVRGPALIGETPALYVIIRRSENPDTFTGEGTFKFRVFGREECAPVTEQEA